MTPGGRDPAKTARRGAALYGERLPAFTEDAIDRLVASRMARQQLFERTPAPLLTFVLEEAVSQRPTGGRMVLRRQLEHPLELGKLRHVEVQVMPTDTEEHAGLAGPHRVLKLLDGSTVEHNEVQLTSRLITDPREVQILGMRYGMIRAQALSPRQTRVPIEKLPGET